VAQQTTLSGTINGSTTTIIVASTTGFPASTPFTLAIDYGTSSNELVDVSLVAGTTLTVTRAVDGTSGQSHSSGAVVRHVSSGRDFADSRAHEQTTTAHGATGVVVGTTNTQSLSNKTLTSPTLSGTVATGTSVFSGTPTFSGAVTLGAGGTLTGTFTGTSATLAGTFAGAPTFSGATQFTGAALFTGSPNFNAAAAGTAALNAAVTGDAFDRFRLQADGGMNWGSGTGARDVTLYRSAADTLKTDDAFVALVETTSSGLTAGTNFSVTSFSGRRTCGVVNIVVILNCTGGTITADAAGNISDTLCATLPAGWRPVAGTQFISYDKGGIADGAVRVATDGTCTLVSLSPTATIVSGQTVNFSTTFVV
jgi:hypothetical protein